MLLFDKDKRKNSMNFNDLCRNLVLLSQLGLSLVTPLLFCLAISWWVIDRFGLGGWVFIPGFFFGLGGSAMVAYKLYLAETGKPKKNDRGDKVFFNRHE